MKDLVLTFPLQLLLAFGGFLFHLLKQWQESVKRNEVFIVKSFIISIGMNVIAIPILIFIGGTLSSDLIVMSPLTCVIMGYSGSSMLDGFVNTKKPKEIVSEGTPVIAPVKPSEPPKP